jgi:hypothetical protein
VSTEEQMLAALDRVVSGREIAEAAACLDAGLRAQSSALPLNMRSYRTWRTDGRLHHFPGNEYSYGRIFVSTTAEAYFRNSVVGGAGAAIVKETFRFSSDGAAHLHEIAALEGQGHRRNDSSEWRWHVVKAHGELEQAAEPCLACHQGRKDRAFQFGYRTITAPKR